MWLLYNIKYIIDNIKDKYKSSSLILYNIKYIKDKYKSSSLIYNFKSNIDNINNKL